MNGPSQDLLVNMLAERYTAGAESYTAHWQYMLAPMGEKLLDMLPLEQASYILDLGCGPGTLTAAIRERSGSALAVGVDISTGMLWRVPSVAYTAWSVMDGRRLAFVEKTFDVLIAAFYLFHLPDLHAGLGEARRVLRRGGTIGMATFHTSPDFPAKQVWEQALAKMIPRGSPGVADLSAVDDNSAMDRPEKLEAILVKAGFGRISTELVEFSYRWDPDDYLNVRSQFGTSGALFRSMNRNSRTALLEEVRLRYAELSANAFEYTPTVLFAVANRPS
jgi:ubiquinone/menaquinone biosynthesis C-methylase UbiE